MEAIINHFEFNEDGTLHGTMLAQNTNYDSTEPTAFDKEKKHVMYTKKDRREALKRYCQQDTWAMVEILRAVRKKI